jgi:hypothetical protein
MTRKEEAALKSLIRYILSVFSSIGGAAALASWAKKNRGEFYGLLAQIIPVEEMLGGRGETLKRKRTGKRTGKRQA